MIEGAKRKVKVCLNMIVKDEEHVMLRCLNNKIGLIDAIAILDTGSSDKTVEIINQFMRDHQIPGEVISRPWRRFGPSRTEALRHGEDVVFRIERGELGVAGAALNPQEGEQVLPSVPEPEGGWSQPLTPAEYATWLSSGLNEKEDSYDGTSFLSDKLKRYTMADLGETRWYFMFADADDLIFPNKEKNEAQKKKRFVFDRNLLERDLYRINMSQGESGVKYAYVWMVKLDQARRWQWNGWLHEYVATTGDWTPSRAFISGGWINSSREGARNRDPLKYLNDAVVLERYLLLHPNSMRELYYLGQSYKDAGKLSLARDVFLKRAMMPGGWDEETYMCWYYAGELTRILELENQAKWLDYFFQAHNVRPQRLEAPFVILVVFRDKRWFRAGWEMAKGIMASLPAVPGSGDTLFVNEHVHSWGFFDMASLFAYNCGDRAAAATLMERSIESQIIPENEKGRILKNLASLKGA